MSKRDCCLLILIAAGILTTYAWPQYSAVKANGGENGKESPPAFQWQGSLSCASTACHNNHQPKQIKGSEYTIWKTQDRHSRAFAVLYDARSKRIEENLSRGGHVSAAWQDNQCLHCHLPGWDETPAKFPERRFSEGVGCEACHGPAEKWRTEHYLVYWKTTPWKEKNRLGMYQTEDLVFRAEQCVSCHVGSAEFNVNHDLIAAGHPLLNFEMAAYQQIMPKHWTEKENEAKIWVLGQVVSARAALRLLAHRADPKNHVPWPEFAEHDCYACHHDLRQPSWRQQLRNRRHAESLPPNDWYLAMVVPALATQVSVGELKGFVDNIQVIEKEMRKSNPSREMVRADAKRAAQHLDKWIGKLKEGRYDNPESLQLWMQKILRESPGSWAPSWDQAAQQYLGIIALYYARRDLVPDSLNVELKEAIQFLVHPLRYPAGFDSPRSFDSKKWEEIKKRLAK